VPSKDLTFSVTIYVVLSVLAMGLLALRRHRLGGELGGKTRFEKWISGLSLIFLWACFLLFSCLRMLGHLG